MSDIEIQNLENQFPALAGSAFAAARAQALASGLNVVESENGVIYSVSPNGKRKPVKQITAPIPDVPGRKILL